MKSYKDPSFQDRVGRAAKAKQEALDRLRTKPPVDEAVLAARRAKAEAREAAAAEKREAKRAERERAEAEKAAVAQATSKPSTDRVPLTEAERKAARDARYAARKKRK